MNKTYPLGYLPDLSDRRDYQYKGNLSWGLVSAGTDYSSRMSPVKNQGKRQSCVAFAMCAILEAQDTVKPDLSEECLYRLIAEPGGGAFPRNACKVIQRLGVPREQFWPYEKEEKDPISTRYVIDWTEHRRALGDAKKWKIAQYVLLQDVAQMKSSLVENGPFALGLRWDKSWFNGYMLDIPRKNNMVGGHMVCVVGFDGARFKFKNSWGKEWGKGGYGWITTRAVEASLPRAWALIL